MGYSTSSTHVGHVGDTLSTSDIKVDNKNRTVKFPYMLCKGDHHSHIFPHMDEASYILENLQLPTSYRKISPNPLLVDGLVNLVPSPIWFPIFVMQIFPCGQVNFPSDYRPLYQEKIYIWTLPFL
jgi:hypothetical protein